MQRQIHHHYYGPASSQYNIEQITGDGRAFQGQVNGQSDMTRTGTSPAQLILDGQLTKEDQAEEIRPLDKYASDLQERLENSVRQAVTFQLGCTEAVEAHYSDNNKHNFDVGDVFRVWHPTNTEVHLCTFLVVFHVGTSMTCLKVVHLDPEQLDYKFESEHVKLKVEHDRFGSNRRSSKRIRSKLQEDEESESYVLYLRKDQEIRDNCWIDILNTWNINWQKEYLFANCGRLEKDSFSRARTDHLTHYQERVLGSGQ